MYIKELEHSDLQFHYTADNFRINNEDTLPMVAKQPTVAQGPLS